MPESLDEIAQQEWRAIAPRLEAMGVLSTIDGKALAGYCDCYSRWVQARQIVARLGLVIAEPIVDSEGKKIGARVKKNPAVSIVEKAAQGMKAFLVEFGMTPASRSRLAVVNDNGKNKPIDPAEKYFASNPIRPDQKIQ